MNRILYLVVTLIISTNQNSNALTLEENNIKYNSIYIQQEITEAPQQSTFDELINPMNDIKHMDHLLTRRKGDIKYYELKVYWKVFIKNLDEKRRNPDQVMLNKRKSIV